MCRCMLDLRFSYRFCLQAIETLLQTANSIIFRCRDNPCSNSYLYIEIYSFHRLILVCTGRLLARAARPKYHRCPY